MASAKSTRRQFLALSLAAGSAWPLVGASEWLPMPPARAERSLCVFSKHLQFLDYDALAETAAEIGFDGVDLTVRPGGHVLPERVEEDLPRAVEAIENVGLTVPLITTAITDPQDPLTEPILRTASALGIRYYRMGYLNYDDETGIEDRLERLQPRLAGLAELNRQYTLHGGYQNHDGTQVGAPVWDLWLLLKDLDPRWIGVQYDVRHATVEGGKSWPLGLRLLARYVQTLVVKDFIWDQDEDGRWYVKNVPLGEGMVDWGAYWRLLSRLPFAGPVSLHFEYPMPGDDGRALTQDVQRRQTVEVMQRDLRRLRSMLEEAGL